ncbi:VanZ family protein [Streptomyces acidiscabies]
MEFTQLILDLLIDAGRVVEVDDLWTNSLGGLLAYWTYLMAMKFVQKKIE